MKKLKFKRKSSFAKRFSINGSGKVKRNRSHTSHLSASKTTKQKRQLRKGSYLSPPDHRRSRTMIGPGLQKRLSS